MSLNRNCLAGLCVPMDQRCSQVLAKAGVFPDALKIIQDLNNKAEKRTLELWLSQFPCLSHFRSSHLYALLESIKLQSLYEVLISGHVSPKGFAAVGFAQQFQLSQPPGTAFVVLMLRAGVARVWVCRSLSWGTVHLDGTPWDLQVNVPRCGDQTVSDSRKVPSEGLALGFSDLWISFFALIVASRVS